MYGHTDIKFKRIWIKPVCDGWTERKLVLSFVILLFVYDVSASVNELQIVFSNSSYEVMQMGGLTDFWSAFRWSVCNRNSHFVRCIQSSSFQGCDGIQNSWEDIISCEEQWPKTKTKWKGSPHTEEDCVQKSQNYCSKGETRTRQADWRHWLHKNSPTTAS